MSDHSQPQVLQLALLGSGKMGQAIAAIAPQRGFAVRLTLDEFSNGRGEGITAENFRGIDICIDFTTPQAAAENIRRVSELGCNMVVGTTGWYDRLDEAREAVRSAGTGLIYGANFSLGVQLFFRAARAAAEIFARYPQYHPYITEAHHQAKKDAPSGTALDLKRKVSAAFAPRDLPVWSIRAGFIPGTHEIGFDSEVDNITLRHESRSRQSFAEGALYAARWVAGKKGFFEFSEILE